MELTNANNENPFDPTPKLKSSPIPIDFIPFNIDENNCNYCGGLYSQTLLDQKYCKNCLLRYIKNVNTTDGNTYLDVHIRTKNQCIQHEITRNIGFCTRNIQEWCEYCSEVSYFNQVVTKYQTNHVYYDAIEV